MASDSAGTGLNKGISGVEVVGALKKEDSGPGRSAADGVDSLAAGNSAAGSEVSRPVETITEMGDCVTEVEVCDRFVERCLGRAKYGLLGATGGRAPREAAVSISDTIATIGAIIPEYDVALM